MNENEKLNLIIEYKNIIRKFIETAAGASDEELDYRAQDDFWTTREHTAHILDCEIFGFTRYRKSVAQPGSAVEAFDQDAFQLKLGYTETNINKSLKIIELLNNITIDHLLTLTGKDWTAYYIEHPERGRDNLEKLVKRRIHHTKEHIEYIKRNRSLYNNR